MNDIERALVASWSPETLAVYADALQMDGDPRGELIAIELYRTEIPRPDLAVRREALVHKWLGFVPGPHDGIRVRFGFVEANISALTRVLATPAAPFLRGVTIEGTNTECLAALRALAMSPRPWLTRLTFVPRRRSERRATVLVDAQLAEELVAATENLIFLDLSGNRLFAAFAHPGLRRLRVVGHDAIEALVEAGPALPEARELFFGFTDDPYGRVAFAPGGLPRTLLAASTLPALVSLDVSPNELQRTWRDDQVAVFELLSEFGVAPRLHELRVPGVRSPEERDQLQHAIETMPELEKLVITSDVDEIVASLRHPLARISAWNMPGPIHDLVEVPALGVRIENHAREHRLSMRRIGELMKRQWAQLAADERTAWVQLWTFLAELPVVDEYGDYQPPPQSFYRLRAQEAIVALGDALEEDPAWRTFADELATARAKTILVRRFAY